MPTRFAKTSDKWKVPIIIVANNITIANGSRMNGQEILIYLRTTDLRGCLNTPTCGAVFIYNHHVIYLIIVYEVRVAATVFFRNEKW